MYLPRPHKIIPHITLVAILLVSNIRAFSSVHNDSLKRVFDEHISQALLYKKKYERDRLDSVVSIALNLAQKLDDEENLAHCNYLKSEGLSQSQPVEAIQYADQSLAYYQKKGDFHMMSVILLTKGNCQSNIGQKREAITTYSTAIQYSLQSPNHESESEQNKRLIIRYSIGMTQLNLGDILSAADNLYQVYEEAKKLDKKNMIPAVLQQLGNLSMYRKKYEDALTLFREGADRALKDNPRALAVNLSGLSSTHYYLGHRDSAIIYAQKALRLNSEHANHRSASVNLGNLAEFLFDAGQIDSALVYNLKLLDLAKAIKMPHREANAQTGLCFCYLKKGELKKAQTALKQVLDKIKSIQEFDRLADVYQCAAELNAALGNHQQAYAYQKIHQQYADSMINLEANEKLDLLHLEYQTKEKMDLIQQLELEQTLDKMAYRQRMLYLTMIAILGLVILGGYLIVSRKQQLKLEKQKENIEQRLLRSQMNPHFIFNAISSIQNYLFDAADQKTALLYLSHFSELMRQILENSRETYISLNAEIEALNNYLQLQLLRYNQKFEFEINVATNIDPRTLMVPPLILQPFVENAIEHGKIYMLEGGKVTIDIQLNQDELAVKIIDNGKGFNQQNNEIRTQIKSSSLGTQITKERLEYLSRMLNKKFDFHFLQNAPCGTQVHLTLPKIQIT